MNETTLIVEAIIFEYQKSKVVDKGLPWKSASIPMGLSLPSIPPTLVDLASLPAGLVASFIKADSFAGLVRAIETMTIQNCSVLQKSLSLMVDQAGSASVKTSPLSPVPPPIQTANPTRPLNARTLAQFSVSPRKSLAPISFNWPSLRNQAMSRQKPSPRTSSPIPGPLPPMFRSNRGR